jgi:hypothetical protein
MEEPVRLLTAPFRAHLPAGLDARKFLEEALERVLWPHETAERITLALSYRGAKLRLRAEVLHPLDRGVAASPPPADRLSDLADCLPAGDPVVWLSTPEASRLIDSWLGRLAKASGTSVLESGGFLGVFPVLGGPELATSLTICDTGLRFMCIVHSSEPEAALEAAKAFLETDGGCEVEVLDLPGGPAVRASFALPEETPLDQRRLHSHLLGGRALYVGADGGKLIAAVATEEEFRAALARAEDPPSSPPGLRRDALREVGHVPHLLVAVDCGSLLRGARSLAERHGLTFSAPQSLLRAQPSRLVVQYTKNGRNRELSFLADWPGVAGILQLLNR